MTGEVKDYLQTKEIYSNYIELTDTVWDDLQVNLGAVGFGASAPTKTAYKSSEVLAFSPTQDNAITFTAQIPHSYKIGTDLDFHLHLTYPNSNAGASKWTVTYSISEIGGVFPTESSASKFITSPQETDNHQLADIVDVDGSSCNISCVLLCSLTREGTDLADTYASDIYLAALDFHFQKDTMGSREELVK